MIKLSSTIAAAGAVLSWHALSAIGFCQPAETDFRPDVSLRINGSEQPVVRRGMPLLLTIRIGNPRAMMAAAHNIANEANREDVASLLAKGKITQEAAKALLADLGVKEEIHVLRLGDDRGAWSEFVRLLLYHPDGKLEPLPWPSKLLAPPSAVVLVLDAEHTGELRYSLDPAAAAKISTGKYRIVAVLEVPADTKLPADRWRGRIQSEVVSLHVEDQPARPTPAEEEKMHLDLANFFKAAGDSAQVLRHAEKALALNPKSIAGNALVGGAKEDKGDLEGALAAYSKALTAFYEKHPKPFRPPQQLLNRVRALGEKVNNDKK